MEGNEYQHKLNDALSKAIRDYVSKLKYLDLSRGYRIEIAELNRVHPISKIESIKLHILLSGKEIEINVDGELDLMERKDDGTRGKRVEFWVRPAKVKFNHETENFDVIDINGFLALDIIR